MKFYLDRDWFIDTTEFIDLSIGVATHGVRAWYLNGPRITPVMEHGFVGSVELGGAVNFRDIYFNPHGHGTHTESHGHISKDVYPVSSCFNQFFFDAYLITITPELIQGDSVITLEQLSNIPQCDALVIRTVPNDINKCITNYSDTNPTYMDVACVQKLNECGIKHLLVDIPSVDKEVDGGILAFHHAFWNVPDHPVRDRTITELIYVPSHAADGAYVLELQVANFDNDAAPSRPLLYKKRKEA
ncbi:MAG: cyclase family protein [Cryomorphaceae bacterium]|nr:cyclase family protein [Cryomorphaceae bacterium]